MNCVHFLFFVHRIEALMCILSTQAHFLYGWKKKRSKQKLKTLRNGNFKRYKIIKPIIDCNNEKWSKAACRKLQPLITVQVNVPSAVYATAAAVLQV